MDAKRSAGAWTRSGAKSDSDPKSGGPQAQVASSVDPSPSLIHQLAASVLTHPVGQDDADAAILQGS